VPPSEAQRGAVGDRLTGDAPLCVAVVDLTINAGDVAVDWLELWTVPERTEQHDLLQALSDELDTWVPLVEHAGLTWRGSNVAVLSGEAARRAVIGLVPGASCDGVLESFGRWLDDRASHGLEAALRLAQEAVAVLRDHPMPEWERGFETSSMFSVLGFLLSLAEDRRSEARSALSEALERGPADGWITRWNLANLKARDGGLDAAREDFESLRESLGNWNGIAHVAMFVPGRRADESLVVVTSENAIPLLELQLPLIECADDAGNDEKVREALAMCAASADESARSAADWAAMALDAQAHTGDSPA
jgi:hypothetical protein